MHANSLNIMSNFIKKYLRDRNLKILDLGSRIVEGQQDIGSYRQLFTNEKWKYIGADTQAGNNVDVVIKSYEFPFTEETFDIIISGQTIEHIEYPWIWINEVTRVLKKGGLCCIIAPAVIHEHKYPIDTYRYYPDGMIALAKWANLKVLEVKRIVATKKLEDTYLIASKGNI